MEHAPRRARASCAQHPPTLPTEALARMSGRRRGSARATPCRDWRCRVRSGNGSCGASPGSVASQRESRAARSSPWLSGRSEVAHRATA
eukprot:324626-Alexandrium_andersonii.AAC.1